MRRRGCTHCPWQHEGARGCLMAVQDSTEQEIYVPAAECCQKHRNVPPIALEHEVYMHVGNQHHVKVDP